MEKIEINSLTLKNLRNYIKDIGFEAYRGDQIFSYFNKNRNKDLENLDQIPQKLREKLSETTSFSKINILSKFESKIDNTIKYLFVLGDNNIIETVLMQYKHGYSICISTQVGCRMGCSFCASTKDGLIRNLSPGEMLNQIYQIEEDLNINISNIVLMGSGEPLDNFENVLSFIDIISDPKGHNLSKRNITLSTCGIVPKIYDLANENIPITLSISLHSPFDEDRKKIMPIGKKYSVNEIIKACKYYFDKTGRRITFEYTLIENVNDRDKDINELKKLLAGLSCHINLIPLNPIEEFNKKRPDKKNVERVKKLLETKNISVTIRREMGSDISASCGQLRRSVTQEIKDKIN